MSLWVRINCRGLVSAAIIIFQVQQVLTIVRRSPEATTDGIRTVLLSSDW